MPKIDKGAIRRGMPMVGGAFPGTLMQVADNSGRSRAPVTYGQPPRFDPPSLDEIGQRMDRLRQKIEAVAQALRQARR